MRKSLLLFIFASCLFNSCDDTFTNDIITTHPNNPPSNRSAFDNYFDWDRINDIETINPFTHTITTMGIPWKKGSSNNLGIPSTWLDENASDPIYANRYYSRENGWELIYSNITESTPTKYFALGIKEQIDTITNSYNKWLYLFLNILFATCYHNNVYISFHFHMGMDHFFRVSYLLQRLLPLSYLVQNQLFE